MKAVSQIARKDLRGIAYERTILFAIILQLFIALFSSFLMVGLTSLYDPSSIARTTGIEYGVGYAGADSPLAGLINGSSDFQLYPMDLSTAVEALKERKLAAVIYIPETEPGGDDPVKVTLYLIQNDIQTAVVEVKIKTILQQYENSLRDLRKSRLEIAQIPLQVPQTRGGDFYEFVYGLLIPLLIFMPAIISSALIIDFITEEYQQGTLETLLASGISNQEVVWGKVVASVVLVPLQAGLWLVLMFVNRIAIANIPQILLHITVFSMVLILIGAIVALHYRERTAAQFVYSTAIVIVMLLVLALPGNPLNQITRLAAGTAGADQWVLLLGSGLMVLGLAAVTTYLASRVERVSKVT
jgi:ABC-2 type transport system permease protein